MEYPSLVNNRNMYDYIAKSVILYFIVGALLHINQAVLQSVGNLAVCSRCTMLCNFYIIQGAFSCGALLIS